MTLTLLVKNPKREKSGSHTFRKYNYQYHWALCRILDEHEKGNEYAVFVEEHEDVTLANSLNVDSALFELNQVKETSKTHTINSLTKAGKNKTSSLIEKLSESAYGKSFSEEIHQINFVSTGGFSFELHKKGFDLEVIRSGELSDDESDRLKVCLGDIDSERFIKKLAFIIPDLPNKSFDLAIEGKISQLINKIAPGCQYNSNSIYNCIIRDLQRKGENCFDYREWSQSLKKKAITNLQVTELIDQHVSRKPDNVLTTELIQILTDEYKLNSLKRRCIISSFNRYYTKKLSNRDSDFNNVSETICQLIKKHHDNFSDTPTLQMYINGKLPENISKNFSKDDDFSGAFLYELLTCNFDD